jgi:integrase
MEKEDILLHLNTLRRQPADDPDQKWIGTYNNRILAFSKFFRWLYSPDEPDIRKRQVPDCMKGIKWLPNKKKSSYKPSDMWMNEEHAIFLRYCPSYRDKCFHAMDADTSARPHELLGLRIKDIQFKIAPDTGIQYALITVSGKTGQRTLSLIDSIPYIKEWIQQHPFSGNPEAPLFIALSHQTFGQQLTVNAIREQYQYQYKKITFPKLLNDGTVPEEDKEIIRKMLEKPWNPYVFRHSSLTVKSKELKEHTLRNHAGWTMTSKMPSVYVHYMGTESAKVILEQRGIVKHDVQKERDLLKPRTCPNCGEPNRHDSKLCGKCKMVLIYDAYHETVQNERAGRQRIDNLEQDIAELKEILKHPEMIAQITNLDSRLSLMLVLLVPKLKELLL